MGGRLEELVERQLGYRHVVGDAGRDHALQPLAQLGFRLRRTGGERIEHQHAGAQA